MYESLLKDVIDIHIHTSPDVRQRRLNDIELAVEAKRVGARAIVIKSHVVPTMDRAAIAETVVPGIRVFGGLTLNAHVGGLNLLAVETALKMNAKFIWLPTSYSANERSRSQATDGVEVVKNGKAVPVLRDIFQLVAASDAALCTGHSTPKETQILVEEAKKQGVKKIIVNHPEWRTVDMSLEEQKNLVSEGVYFERCYARALGGGQYDKNFQRNLEAIEKIGYQSTIIATDGGQVENPLWSEALGEYLDFLLKAGISQEQLDHMVKRNPALILGLD